MAEIIIGISESTINFHVKNAMRKLGLTSRTPRARPGIDESIVM
ncbi:hypothetical protein EOA75_19675 [Mesorhizobium sp. M1A.F.Ca.IN.022.07.1.1]|nr:MULTISPECIES: LuxR C-terminal-related transcriptional regulator [unclassified Mesorhizobium]RUV91412.1 hypothetical protein EOA75_19675 [Mesorhizobium sp. M1A.F.Ca.IN.022.07.1.1]RWM65090.1 MAG: hypothetical protein EOR82_31480 [Mesorhizobium sp.]RWM89339.1 MAG: hypothetical protein EOR86_29770 [Mesorhizobium sp.]TIS70943.1 MAG: hypothetical protein E5X11_02885 [Mesorhizobium sp.]TJV54538.1 MAG: hypothetical protein E5X82_31425 [Mesorhizobium sp.]